jgi:hypothetical protein
MFAPAGDVMAAVATAFMRMLILALVSLGLAACGPAMFEGRTSLAEITQPTTPMRGGTFKLERGSRKDDAELFTFTLRDGGVYELTTTMDGWPPAMKARFLGPIGGLHLLELECVKCEQYTFLTLIVRIDHSGRIDLAGFNTFELMEELLLEALQLPAKPGGEGVKVLTDSAYINWSLFQELIIRFRDQIEFEMYLEPVPVDD